MIDEYRFGFIKVNGKEYFNDVEVRWDGTVLDWPREKSHVFTLKDAERAAAQDPEVIIMGTGESGAARLTEECKGFIKEKGIDLVADRTEEAVKTFNIIFYESLEEEGRQKRVIGLFHLTC
jgi:hypothetical protein